MWLIVCKYIIYFIIYSVIGWIIEVLVKLFQEKRFINRGFLIGPVCPIYGWGVLLIVSLIHGDDILSVFLKSIFICSILEYTTSFVMEKIYKVRWWDYSNKRFNINGRICLETMIPFGIMGSIVILYVHPFISKTINNLSHNTIVTIAIFLSVLYLIDNLISFNVMHRIKGEIKKVHSDSTEVIRKKITRKLKNNVFVQHIINAFPKFRIIKNFKERKKE